MAKIAKLNAAQMADLITIPKKIPQNAVVITYSEMDSFRQCPLKHFWSYKQQWAKTPKEGSALSRGTLWHSVMETHYTLLQRYSMIDRKKFPDEIVENIKEIVIREVLHDEYGKQTEDQELMAWMYEGHLERYGTDPTWEIIAIESAGQLRLPVPGFPGRRGKYWLRFKIDMLIRDTETGNVWIVDHKSAKDFSRQTEIDVDDQFGLYTWALRQMGIDVFGFIRSDARTQRNKGPMELDNRFRRIPTFRTPAELSSVASDVYRVALVAWPGGNKPASEPYSAPAPDRCSWRCDFLEVHLRTRKGADATTALKDFGFEQSVNKHREYEANPVLERI